jgi:hypothetical protein
VEGVPREWFHFSTHGRKELLEKLGELFGNSSVRGAGIYEAGSGIRVEVDAAVRLPEKDPFSLKSGIFMAPGMSCVSLPTE